MQTELSLLRKLQDYDLEILEIEDNIDKIRESLDELYGLRDALLESLEAQKEQLDQTRSLMKAKQVDLEANDERLGASRAKINQVANTREYNALEKEIETLRKLRAQLEEEQLQLREAVDDFAADVKEKEAKLAGLQGQIDDEESEVGDQSADAEKRVAKLRTARDKIKKDLPKAAVRRYEFISTRRPGLVVVPARAGVCTGCNMMLPPQLFNDVQRGDRILQCPNCQRIIFHEDEAERAAAEG